MAPDLAFHGLGGTSAQYYELKGLRNNRHVRGYSETTCPPLPPEDGRFDPTSPASIDSS
jgi:hypothetical protein